MFRLARLATPLAIAALAIAPLLGAEPAVAASSTFSGVLRDRDGGPVPNVQMQLDGLTTTYGFTAADGRFSIAVAPGTYSLRMIGSAATLPSTLPRLFDIHGPAGIDLSTSRDQDITLRTVYLNLTVLDPDGHAVPDASVEAGGPSLNFDFPGGTTTYVDFRDRGTTDASGRVRLVVFAGDVFMTISIPGSPVQPFTATVTSDTSVVFPDRIAPVLSLPGEQVVYASSADGEYVSYTTTVTDNVDPSPALTCSPDSGNLFAIGSTSVVCSATDSSGNTASGTFNVRVLGGREQMTRLIEVTRAIVINRGIEQSLVVKLEGALVGLDSETIAPKDVCARTEAFIKEVSIQTGTAIPPVDAMDLTDRARRIQAVIGCLS